MPAQQTPLSQLAPVLHPRPAGQDGQGGPPQSTPVSSPFRTPSSHVAGTQRSPSQTLVLQSALDLQASPMMQGRHGPPQSRAVSPRAVSTASFVQCAGTHSTSSHAMPLGQSFIVGSAAKHATHVPPWQMPSRLSGHATPASTSMLIGPLTPQLS
jgi:hypothetical protein